MLKFNIITIFPYVFEPYLSESILGRARENKLVDFNLVNLREFTTDKHRSVDDVPFGGGAGMILKIEPIYKAVKFQISNFKFQREETKKRRNEETGIPLLPEEPCVARGFAGGTGAGGGVISSSKTKIILLSAKGQKFTQEKARELSQLENIVLICGRYEGVDERVAEYIADEEISIGDYVLTGGELPAMVIADAVTRLIPGVISAESLREESFSVGAVPMCPPSSGVDKEIKKQRNKETPAFVKAMAGKGEIRNLKFEIGNYSLEYPQYTRPAVFKTDEGEEWKVPEVLLSGNHGEIRKWRNKIV